jgi:hypothetical protein
MIIVRILPQLREVRITVLPKPIDLHPTFDRYWIPFDPKWVDRFEPFDHFCSRRLMRWRIRNGFRSAAAGLRPAISLEQPAWKSEPFWLSGPPLQYP